MWKCYFNINSKILFSVEAPCNISEIFKFQLQASCLQALTVFLGTDGTVGNKLDSVIHWEWVTGMWLSINCKCRIIFWPVSFKKTKKQKKTVSLESGMLSLTIMVIHLFLSTAICGSMNVSTLFSALFPLQFVTQHLRTIFSKESTLNFVDTTNK